MRAISIAALVALAEAVHALEFDPNGNALGFDTFRHRHPVAAIRRRGNPTVGTATTYASELYYVNITLGTPPQSMAIQIDTGSSDFWMPTLDGGCNAGCMLGGYAPKKSSTYQVVEAGAFNTSYAGLDTASGDFGADSLGIGGFTLANFTLGVASKLGGPPPFVGVMGLSYPALEQVVRENPGAAGYPTIVEALYDAGKIDARAFSLYLNDFNSPGALLFGGVDTAKFQGELAIVDLQVSAGFEEVSDFTVALTGLSFTAGGQVNTISLGTPAISALLDSGTSSLTLPNDQAMALYDGIGVEYYPGGIAVIPCNAAVSGMTLNFTFGSANGPNIGVPLNQFIVPYDAGSNIPDINGNHACEFAVQPAGNIPQGSGTAILGDSFLRGAYVVFDLDNKQAAIAPAILNATASNILPIAAAGGGSAVSTAAASTGTVQTSLQSASSPVTNSIPSATLVADQNTLQAPSLSYTGAAAISTGASLVTPSATFKGLPSGGINNPTHNAAPGNLHPADWTSIWVSGVALLLSVIGGGFWALLF